MKEFATLVIKRSRGGYGTIINTSKRGLFRIGQRYFNHRLKKINPYIGIVNIVIRLSPKGKRMVQAIYYVDRTGESPRPVYLYGGR